jgi:hypothetical protein
VGDPAGVRLSEDREARIERLYAEAERKNETRKAATVRRGPVSLIGVCLGVALLVGVVAAVDLRRLQTPDGTALAWTGAAVFGDCTAFRRLSALPDERDDDEDCRVLRRRSEAARDRPAEVEIEVLSASEEGDRAAAVVRVRQPGTPAERVPLSMVRGRGGGWAVELTDETCALVPCP